MHVLFTGMENNMNEMSVYNKINNPICHTAKQVKIELKKGMKFYDLGMRSRYKYYVSLRNRQLTIFLNQSVNYCNPS